MAAKEKSQSNMANVQTDAEHLSNSNIPQNKALATAITFANRGIPVFPCNGKKPLTTHGCKDATTNITKITVWAKKSPNCNWAAATGKQLFVIDADSEDALSELEDKYGKLPSGPRVITTKGLHYYFEGCELGNTASKLAEKIDTRGVGGYIMLPGSIHPDSGKEYVFDCQASLDDLTLPKLPQAWLGALAGNKTRAFVTPEEFEIEIPQGQRHVRMTRLIGKLLTVMSHEQTLATALLHNMRWVKPPLPDAEIERMVADLAKKERAKPKKANQEEQEKVMHSSFIATETNLYEQIYRNGKCLFASYQIQAVSKVTKVSSVTDTKVEEVDQIQIDGITYRPIEGEEISQGFIRLPSGVAEYGDMVTLIAKIQEYIGKYLDVPELYLKLASLYILLSYVYDRFNTLSYLRALGDTGCGKSRFLDVIIALCYKAMLISGAVSVAPIYRMIQKWGGTLGIDESDLKNSDEYNEVVTILNCGFERNRPVIRCEKHNPDKLQFFNVFGPKGLATRRNFSDKALEARCLTQVMEETTRSDIPVVLGANFYVEQEELRNMLLLFRFRNYHRINPEKVVDIDLTGIEPRLRQITTCFIPLLADSQEALDDFKKLIYNHQREIVEQRQSTLTGQVVEKFLELIDSATAVTFETTVTGEKLLNISAQDIADKLDKVRPQTVGQILKSLGLTTRSKKIGGETKRCIIYDKGKIAMLRKRYILQDIEVTAV